MNAAKVDVLAVLRAAKVLSKQYVPMTDDPALREAQMLIALEADDALAATAELFGAVLGPIYASKSDIRIPARERLAKAIIRISGAT